jgi:hypothetical protein
MPSDLFFSLLRDGMDSLKKWKNQLLKQEKPWRSPK